MILNLDHVSKILGWTYFSAWSISFYPQIILNWRRKSVQGLSIDFLWYNVYGFACYSIFNLLFFSSEKIRKEYRDHNGGKENLVQVNDVVFALHALLLSSISLFQTYIYKRDANQKISSISLSVIVVSILGAISLLASVQSGINQWIDLLYFLSYVKLGLSFIKYLPQIYLNFERKSTIGWSIHNILLDFTGGVLSTFQLVLDAYSTNNWDGVLGDPVKLGLGFLSIIFDIIFMIQHYVLYRNRGDHEVYSKNLDGNISFENDEDAQNGIIEWERVGLLSGDKNNHATSSYV